MSAIYSQEKKPSTESVLKEQIYLSAKFQITLHTKIGTKLFYGSWKLGYMGLVQFSQVVKQLWKACKEDDPYAEYYLLKIYDVIEDARTKLKNYEKVLEGQMSSLRGFKIDMMTNQNPLNYSLQFSTPFSFMAATLVENVDFLNRQIFTLYRMGVIPKENLIQKDLIRQIQNVFSLPRKWRYTGVTRRDILEKNQKAKLAEELLGEIPNAVLNQEIKFTFLPKGHIDEKANKTLSIE